MKYRYKARAQGGKIESGIMEGTTVQSVVEQIRKKGMLPISIDKVEEKKAAGKQAKDTGSSKGLIHKMKLIGTVPLKDKAVFFRQLSTMIKAGVNIGSSLNILSDQTKNLKLSDAISQVKKKVDSGNALSAAMKLHSLFPPMSISIIQAGEEGGTLDGSLERVADFLERQDALHKKIVSAITYPAVVMAFSMFVLYLLITVVMPKFATVFNNLNIELPAVTKFMFNFGIWMADNWILFISSVIAIVVSLSAIARWKVTKPYMDRVKLKLPIFGDLIFKADMARSTRTLASLTHSGIPILQALDMTSRISGNSVFENAFKSMELAARKGAGLGDTARNIKIFPPMVAHMLRVGEETGQVDEMLNKVADWFELELDEKIKRLTSILEPVLIVFVGGVVAIVALAIFSPIVTAIQEML
ncbi:type II secretion system F family protein [Dethiosulfovibrio salsuginis]|uniref:Type IV pilus assembly protein PilC n=1 Tax=Dethiosulfovibrio salsuginis TaxID=561720 RepID=A0A1X7I221_9BACT|nr:type II secretion system F family protein [Dethiosulfovibrio salsuginis]SMG08043.1 type IV pilus assembly protein PilC [Dethiosulfovibrio salsuginis]